jgi:hypothetical protein
MPIHRANHTDENAIAISNELIDDRRLSAGAFGLAIWMCGQQQQVKGWLVPDPTDIPRTGYESVGQMKGHFEELVEAGYLVQEVPDAPYTLKPGLWKWPSAA